MTKQSRFLRGFQVLCILCALPVVFSGCNSSAAETPSETAYQTLEGETMGTYYRITFADGEERDLKPQIDQRLQEVNGQVSTYIDTSTISRFNQAEEFIDLSMTESHFLANFEKSEEVFHKTDGAFDPTVMPLVNYWGFGYTEKKPVTRVDSVLIDSLLILVGFDQVELRVEEGKMRLYKELPGIQLDFSAIAKGYGVDEVGRLLDSLGVHHYLIDIGGEVLGKGKSSRGDPWNIGINMPLEEAGLSDVQTAVPLDNRAVATSGNYRNFYEVEGRKYSHTINPKTGFPERNPLLSASVFAPDCMTADAFATACMVLGVDKAYELIGQQPDLDGYFIYSDSTGVMHVRYTEGLKEHFGKKEE